MKYIVVSLLLGLHGLSIANELELPRGLELVISERVDQSKIRAIGYNMHITPEIEIQRLKIPGLILQERRIIKKVTVDDRVFDFKECTYVEYTSLTFADNQVHFELEFIPLIDPNNWLLNCKVDVSHNQIGEPQCTKTRFEWPEEM